MSSKLVFVVVATLACHCVCGRSSTLNTNGDLTEADREKKILIEVPFIGTVLMVAFQIIGLFVNAIRPVFQYNIVAFTLIDKITSWLYQNYLSVIIGAFIVLVYCLINSLFTEEPENEINHKMLQATRQLEAGALKYARIIN